MLPRGELASSVPALSVWTKGDQALPDPDDSGETGSIVTSAATGIGLDELRSAIARAFAVPGGRGQSARRHGARCRGSLQRAECGLRSRPSESLVDGAGRRAGRLRPAIWPSTSWARSSAPWSPTTSSTGSSAGSASGNELSRCREPRRRLLLADLHRSRPSVDWRFTDHGVYAYGTNRSRHDVAWTLVECLQATNHDTPIPHRNRHDGRNEGSGRPALGRADPALARELQDRRRSDAARR